MYIPTSLGGGTAAARLCASSSCQMVERTKVHLPSSLPPPPQQEQGWGGKKQTRQSVSQSVSEYERQSVASLFHFNSGLGAPLGSVKTNVLL